MPPAATSISQHKSNQITPAQRCVRLQTITIPFLRQEQLYKKLVVNKDDGNPSRVPDSNGCRREWIPGYPLLGLRDPMIGKYLMAEFCTPRLDRLAPHLWLVATQDPTHVTSLTQQIVRGRRIVVTEDPELHLVWIQDRVFIKPLPKIFLSYDFWEHYLMNDHSPISHPSHRLAVARAARGFLRTYSCLIRRKFDLRLAQHDSHPLVPRGIHFAPLIRLLATVGRTSSDSDISPRYHYGELRLSRLNFWTKIFLHDSRFAKVHWQYGAYLAQHYTPVLVVFGFLSVILSAMQVGLGAASFYAQGSDFVRGFSQASKGFAVFALTIICVCFMYLFALWFWTATRETVFAITTRWSKRERSEVAKSA